MVSVEKQAISNEQHPSKLRKKRMLKAESSPNAEKVVAANPSVAETHP